VAAPNVLVMTGGDVTVMFVDAVAPSTVAVAVNVPVAVAVNVAEAVPVA